MVQGAFSRLSMTLGNKHTICLGHCGTDLVTEVVALLTCVLLVLFFFLTFKYV